MRLKPENLLLQSGHSESCFAQGTQAQAWPQAKTVALSSERQTTQDRSSPARGCHSVCVAASRERAAPLLRAPRPGPAWTAASLELVFLRECASRRARSATRRALWTASRPRLNTRGAMWATTEVNNRVAHTMCRVSRNIRIFSCRAPERRRYRKKLRV
jgi:hypothetical protein